MPNPLAPGVYIEEVPFASHLVEGVPTSITGFVAITGRGRFWVHETARNSRNKVEKAARAAS